MHKTIWPDDTSVEFHLPHGEWIRLLRAAGFEIERLVEIQAPVDATTTYTPIATDRVGPPVAIRGGLVRRKARLARRAGDVIRRRGYSPITLQRKPIEMKKPVNRAISPRPP